MLGLKLIRVSKKDHRSHFELTKDMSTRSLAPGQYKFTKIIDSRGTILWEHV